MSKRSRLFGILGRLADMDLDQLRLRLSQLQTERDAIDTQIAKLKADEAKESDVAAKYPVESVTTMAFINYTKEKIAELRLESVDLDEQIEQCLEELRVQFQESKKMELVKDKEIMRESKKQKHQEQSFYDQIAESRYHRSKRSIPN